MGSNRKLIFGAVLVVAGLVFWGLMTALNRVSRVASRPTPLPVTGAVQPVNLPPTGRLVAYAASDIAPGTLVTKNMIEMRPLAGGGPTTPFVTDPQAQALNFVSATRIPKGDLIRPGDDFVGHISEVGIAGMLQSGRRAIVIPFANKPTLHDLVGIGDRIDINSAFDGQEARTIVPDVRVLAVDVFGADFPQVNIARRGSFKAEPRGGAAPATAEAPAVPGAAPTPTPAPAPAAGRPDPAITLEVTPDQANRILLAQASGGVLDFVVLPTRDATIVGSDPLDSSNAVPGSIVPGGESVGQTANLIAISAVTKPQIAPYAERKKAAGGASGASAGRGAAGGTRIAAAGGASGSGSSRASRSPRDNPFPLPPLPDASGGGGGGGIAPAPVPDGGSSLATPPIPAESPTYNIPIYADGRTVRVETVPRPQE